MSQNTTAKKEKQMKKDEEKKAGRETKEKAKETSKTTAVTTPKKSSPPVPIRSAPPPPKPAGEILDEIQKKDSMYMYNLQQQKRLRSQGNLHILLNRNSCLLHLLPTTKMLNDRYIATIYQLSFS